MKVTKLTIKKNEVKVTVIASGFPEGIPKKGLFHFESEVKEDKKPKLFGGGVFTAPAPKEVKVEEKKPEPKVIENDDEWGAVPAFLRRSKK